MHVLVAIYGDTAAWTIPPALIDVLRRRFPGIRFSHAETEDEMVRRIADADVAFTSRLTSRAFAAATRLRWVHSPAAGVGSMLFPEMRSSQVLLTNSRGMNATPVAEHAFALLLALSRRVPDVTRRQAEHRWAQDELSGLPTLGGRTLGIVGLGSIGSALARIAGGFGMRIVAIRRRVGAPVQPGVDRVYPPTELPTLLREADAVVLSAPLTAETRALIGSPELRQMKPTAWLVNIARGKLVKEADLVAALVDGTIAGAALDVFEHEPLDPASPLWDLPNVIVSPHLAGFREDNWEAAADLFAANLERFLSSEPLLNVVDREAGY